MCASYRQFQPESYWIDETKVRLWSVRDDAKGAAVALGWRMNQVLPVHSRTCRGFALRATDGVFLSREEYKRLRESLARAADAAQPPTGEG